MTLNEAIQTMTAEIVSILADNKPSIYLFGSVVFDDFKLGWSDIDIVVLTKRGICEQQANILVELRQAMSERYPGNPFFRLFEGGMISAYAFLNNKKKRTVYWGTSGQRITDGYKMDSFSMAELLDNGVLLHGEDIRGRMTYPTYAQMRDDVARHAAAVRKYGDSVGWLLDVARGIYTLRTGKVIAKTAAGEWVLENGLCPDADVMRKAVGIRKAPHGVSREEKAVDKEIVSRFADVLDEEFLHTTERFAKTELRRMNIDCNALSLIRNKDCVSVWRVVSGADGYVMKCFDKPEYRREIANYQLLTSLGVPTLKVIAHTDCSILLEDIERSAYRLGTEADMNDPDIAGKIALWYKSLHQSGREYLKTHDFIDEYDCLTLENLKMIQGKTGTGDFEVWNVIKNNFERIKNAVMSLPRTLVYTDFHYTNLAVARDGSSALVFDYNFLFKSFAYSDIRNVCWDMNGEAKAAFLSAYGEFDEREVAVDAVASELYSLIVACGREVFPDWAKDGVEKIKNGGLLAAVQELLEVCPQ